jgi:hypothetical protein
MYLAVRCMNSDFILFNRYKNPEPKVFEELTQSVMAYFPVTKGSNSFYG